MGKDDLAIMPKADPIAAAAIHQMQEQLLIILLERLGGSIDLTVKEIDTASVGKVLATCYHKGVFHLEVQDY